MTTYVLIVVLYYQRAGITAEFSSKEKCEAAGKAVVERLYEGWGQNAGPRYICVEK